METMYKALVNCPLFRGLSAERIKELIGNSDNYVVNTYQKGDVIAHRDSNYSGLMILLSGKITGQMTYRSGKNIVIDMVEESQLIAPAFLFGGYNRLPVDVIAQTQTQILTLHRGFIFELMQENVIILSNFIDIISNRANVWSKKIYLLSFQSLKSKVVSYVLDNSSDQQPVLKIPEVDQIADYFLSTRSSVIAVLDDLSKRKFISVEGQTITVVNRCALSDILKEE